MDSCGLWIVPLDIGQEFEPSQGGGGVFLKANTSLEGGRGSWNFLLKVKNDKFYPKMLHNMKQEGKWNLTRKHEGKWNIDLRLIDVL